ncbi:MAG: YibE/F family protein [Actinomycetia bacterium]|nr:YibE/F family protein [Actinomycetes bacterium]
MKKNIFIVMVLLIIIVSALFGCSGEPKHTIEEWDEIEGQKLSASGEELQFKAIILEIVSDQKQDSGGGLESRQQVFKVRITNGPFKGEIIETNNLLETNSIYNIEVNEGDQIFILPEFDGEGNIINSYITETVKDKYLIIITVLFTIILIIIGKFKGVKAAIALAITAVAIVKILLPLILKGHNPILISGALAIAITIITLLIISGINRKTLSTIIGTSTGILIGGTLALLFGKLSNLTGLSSEEARMLAFIPQDISFDYRGILFAGIILASLGAVMDVSMSVSSSMFEIVKADPTIKKNDLISAGMNVGRDIIGTMSNTLILVYIGSALPLMLLFLAYDISFIEVINKDIIASEIIRALSGSIGLIMAIPVSVYISASMYDRKYVMRLKNKKL